MNMKRVAILIIAGIVATGALAQSVEGKWSVEGQNPKGQGYEGELTITPTSELFHKLQWNILYDNKSQADIFPGTAFLDKKNKKMIAAYGIGTLRYGLFTYELNEEGGLAGNGSWVSHLGRGAELIGGMLNKKKLPGLYEIVGRRSVGDTKLGASDTYKGTLKIEKDGDMYKLNWYLGDGTPYEGFGYVSGGQLIGVWGIGGSFGLEIYSLNEDMTAGKSTWTSPSYDYKQGREMIEKSE
jgi:hypothetical protein